MKTVEEIRRLRLLQLREEFGSYVKLGERLGMTPRDSTLSQYANGSSGSKTGQPKGMGSTLARRIEAACGKATGWMDSDPDVEQLLWPFGDRVDIGAIASLPPDFLSEAVGALNDVLRRASAAPRETEGVGGLTCRIYTMPRRRPASNPATEGPASKVEVPQFSSSPSRVVDINGFWGLF